MLWDLMRAFYDGQGLEAWSTADPVPHYVTTSPRLAKAYSAIIAGYLHDVASSPDFDPGAPMYIVELGAGHGRLGYRLVRRLLLTSSGADAPRWVYVMSDLSDRNLASWGAQPGLRPLVDAGVLDFARFDIGADDSMTLQRSGTVLSPGQVANPMVAVANYIFDSLPQDAFYVQGGELYERRVTLSSRQPEPDLTDPTIIERVDVSCAHYPASAATYYDQPAWNDVLEAYRDLLPEAAIAMPTGALAGIAALERLSAGRMLVLAGDKGWTRANLLPSGPEPLNFAVHASRAFSMMVNFDAIARYAEGRGGVALLPQHDASSLVIAAFLTGRANERHPETIRRYREEVDAFGPDDFYTFMRGVTELWPSLGPDQICACLQLAGGDDFVLASCLPILLDVASSLPDHLRKQLRAIVQDTWDGYLPIGEEADRAFQFGTLLYELGYHADALGLFEASAAAYGRMASTLYNMAACEFALGNVDGARAAVKEALEQDPKHEAARELRLRLESAS